MKVIRQVFLLLVFCTLYFSARAGEDSCNLKISILTCSPGDDLYSVWGHSAVRVINTANHTDLIYNYGTFDFEDPDFYIKFVKGKLLYFVSIEQYDDFMYSYMMEKRSIIEQQLDISCEEKQKLSAALSENAKEENKYYFYQFFFDNCSTRMRDIVSKNLNDSVHFKNILPHPSPTFRTMIHYYLDNSGQYWSKAGIDLLLGSLIDRRPDNRESMFIPDYLMVGFDSALENDKPIVSSKKMLLGSGGSFEPLTSSNVVKDHGFFWLTPLLMTCILLLTGGVVTFVRRKWAEKFLNAFDVTLFFIIGGAGCLIVFMWFGTEHDLCSKNFNLLWALPTHLFISFVMLKNKHWVRQYFKVVSVLYLVVLFAWSFLPQSMNPAFLPLILLAGIRSFKRSFFNPAP